MDLRNLLYSEKEEVLDKLDSLMVYANLLGYYVKIEDTSYYEVYISFTKDSNWIVLLKQKVIVDDNNSTLYGRGELFDDKEFNYMSLYQAAEVLMKIL